MKVSIELPDVAGYEIAEGEQPRDPMRGDRYTTFKGDAIEASYNYHNDRRIILKKKAPVYTVLGMGDLGCIVFGVDVRGSDDKYVEIKALEVAMELIESHYNWPALSKAKIAALKELL